MKYTALFISLILLAAPVGAQRVTGNRVGLSQQATPYTAGPTHRAMHVEAQQSYWLAGTVIGGVLGLVGGLQLQNGLCNFDSPCSGSDHFFFVIPTLVFAVLGGLIGSTIHKR